MKDRFRFWGLYLGLILSFVLHYFATSQLKIYENHLWELLIPRRQQLLCI